MKIAIIGSGNLGLSIAKGLVYNNTYTSLYLTKRDLEAIKKWKEYNNVIITDDNKKAVKNSDIIIFTVQPSQFDHIFRGYQRRAYWQTCIDLRHYWLQY